MKYFIATLVVLGLGIAAYVLFFKSSSSQVEVSTVVVKNGGVQSTVTATGTVEPITQVDVGTQVSAEVKKIYVDFNSTVTKGQLIAELDKTNLKIAVLDAQANYDKSISERTYLQGIYRRQKELFEGKLISELAYEEALFNIENINGTVTQRQSNLDIAKTNLSYANIYSPINGVVLSRDVDEGQTVAASFSSPTLFTIAQDLKEMQVETDVDEADIGQVKVGQRVSFLVDAYPDDEFSGTVTQVRLNPTVSSNVVTYNVIIKAKNEEMKLMPGLTATVTIYTYESENVLTIENKALIFKPNHDLLMSYNGKREEGSRPPTGNRPPNKEMMEGERVFVLNNGKIHPKPVTIGVSDGINVEVLDGLSIGDSIIYSMSSTSTTNLILETVEKVGVRSCKNHQEENRAMTKSIIHIEQIERHFQMGDEVVKALRKVDLNIAEGEFITIMGSSGSGKSTLLNLIGCLDSPSTGVYQLDGVNVGELNKNELAEIRNKKIGFIFQSYNLLARTSALENVELPLLYNSSVSNTERRERAQEALKSVGLLDRMNHTPSELSGGQQQRVAIARALVNNPVVILADEATGNLDTKTSYEIMALFQQLNEEGKTIVFVTHEPDIAQFSSRTIVLKDGKIITDKKVQNRSIAKDILLNYKEEEEE